MTGLWVAGALALALAAALWWVRRRYDGFRFWAVARLRDVYPDLAVEHETPAEITGRLAGVPVRLDLASLFRQLKGHPGGAALDQVVDAMRAALPAPESPPFHSVRAAVLPLIKPAAFAEVYRRYPPVLHLVTLAFAEGLVVVYVILGFQQIIYVTTGMQQAWQTTTEELHRLALENLRRRTEHLLMELGGPQAAYAHLDGFEAARILIPDLVTPPGVADPLLAIPDEHILLAGGARDAARLAQEAAAAYAGARSPLSPAIFRLREASLVPEVVS